MEQSRGYFSSQETKEQGLRARGFSLFPFYSVWAPAYGMALPALMPRFSSIVSPVGRYPLGGSRKCSSLTSWMFLSPVKLTDETSHPAQRFFFDFRFETLNRYRVCDL